MYDRYNDHPTFVLFCVSKKSMNMWKMVVIPEALSEIILLDTRIMQSQMMQHGNGYVGTFCCVSILYNVHSCIDFDLITLFKITVNFITFQNLSIK
jgi:hypothetical protein